MNQNQGLQMPRAEVAGSSTTAVEPPKLMAPEKAAALTIAEAASADRLMGLKDIQMSAAAHKDLFRRAAELEGQRALSILSNPVFTLQSNPYKAIPKQREPQTFSLSETVKHLQACGISADTIETLLKGFEATASLVEAMDKRKLELDLEFDLPVDADPEWAKGEMWIRREVERMIPELESLKDKAIWNRRPALVLSYMDNPDYYYPYSKGEEIHLSRSKLLRMREYEHHLDPPSTRLGKAIYVFLPLTKRIYDIFKGYDIKTADYVISPALFKLKEITFGMGLSLCLENDVNTYKLSLKLPVNGKRVKSPIEIRKS